MPFSIRRLPTYPPPDGLRSGRGSVAGRGDERIDPGRVHHHGRAVILAVLEWGLAITGLGPAVLGAGALSAARIARGVAAARHRSLTRPSPLD